MRFRSPIKAQLVTFNDVGRETKKRKTLACWFASNERIQSIEVRLENDGENFQSIYINFESLMKDVRRYERNK